MQYDAGAVGCCRCCECIVVLSLFLSVLLLLVPSIGANPPNRRYRECNDQQDAAAALRLGGIARGANDGGGEGRGVEGPWELECPHLARAKGLRLACLGLA